MPISPHNNRRQQSRPTLLFPLEAKRLMDAGQARQAVEVCKRGLIYFPEHVTGYLALAQAYLYLGQRDRAINVLRDGFRRTGSEQIAALADELATGKPRTTKVPAPLPIPLANGSAPSEQLRGQTPTPIGGSIVLDEELPPILPEAEDETVGLGVEDAELELSERLIEEAMEEEEVHRGGVELVVDAPVEELRSEEESPELTLPEPALPEQPEKEPERKEPEKKEPEPREPERREPEPPAPAVEEPERAEKEWKEPARATTTVEREATATVDHSRSLSLALHKGMNVARLRSSNLRLIPGLEFAPLRHEEQPRKQTIASLFDDPMPHLDLPVREAATETSIALPSLLGAEVTASVIEEKEVEPPVVQHVAQQPPSVEQPAAPAFGVLQMVQTRAHLRDQEAQESGDLTPLEELARRLENARIPVVEEIDHQHHAFEPSIVSDTLANILVEQGAYVEALKAFQTLARAKPERFDYYMERIQEMKRRMGEG